jgi:Ni,Fe-hydrogenase I small subunit
MESTGGDEDNEDNKATFGDWEDVQYQPELDVGRQQNDMGDENNDDTFGTFDGPMCKFPFSHVDAESPPWQLMTSTSKRAFKQCLRCAARWYVEYAATKCCSIWQMPHGAGMISQDGFPQVLFVKTPRESNACTFDI